MAVTRALVLLVLLTPRKEAMKTLEGKVVVLGSQGVGKTSIILRYMNCVGHRASSDQVKPTIGASFFTWALNLDNARVKLQVWDTAGQERFRSMAPMYYRKANAAMLVFDLAEYATFAAVKSWVLELRRNLENPLVFALIGNKSDLQEEREVSGEEARLYARDIGASYHETSVLNENGVEIVFQTIARRLAGHPHCLTSEDTASLKLNDSASSTLSSDSGNDFPKTRSSVGAHGKGSSRICC